MPLLAHHQVIQQLNVHEPVGLYLVFCEPYSLGAGARMTSRMVVQHDDPRSGVTDSRSQDLAHPHEKGIEASLLGGP